MPSAMGGVSSALELTLVTGGDELPARSRSRTSCAVERLVWVDGIRFDVPKYLVDRIRNAVKR